MSFDISCVNKIKLEKEGEFKESIFSNVYEKAGVLVKSIMKENKSNAEADKEMQYAGENYICNIIAFIGKRGMGKSSAMLSFACSLKKEFYLLPKIDMSMVTKNESLLDMILAYMWEKYEKENTLRSSKKDLRKNFADVKDSYMRFKRMQSQNNSDDELYSAKELKKLAKSLRLRECFSVLVEDFLDAMINDDTIAKADRYLVFVIDDLDLASNNPGEVLEQIKNFLSVPKVIVLTTLDIERSILSKRAELDTQFPLKYKYDSDVDNVVEYANDYIAKVIPFNRRIYMPDIHEKTNEHMISLNNKYGKIIGWKKKTTSPKNIDYEQYCNLILYTYTGILTDPKMGSIFGEHESLRGIVNGLNELCELCNPSNKGCTKEAVEAWIKKEITVLADRIDNEELYNFYINYSNYPEYRFNDLIVQSTYYFTKKQNYMHENEIEIRNFEDSLNGVTYSDMLAFWVAMKKKLYINDWNKIKNVLWIYSITAQKKSNTDILSRCIREASNDIIERETYLPNVFDIEITDIREDGMELNDKDYKKITDLIKCMLFTDVSRLVNQRYQIKRGAVKQMQQNPEVVPNIDNAVMTMEMAGNTVKISFDSFVKNICDYESCCKNLIEWLLNNIYSEADLGSKNVKREQSFSRLNENLKIENWKEWNQNHSFIGVEQLFPLQSLGYMVGLAERLDSNLRKKSTQLFSVLYSSVIDTITEYMRESERYYFIDNGVEKKSVLWKELLKIVDINDIDETQMKRLIPSPLNDKSQFSSTTM